MCVGILVEQASESISKKLTSNLENPQTVRREVQGEIAAYLRGITEQERRKMASRLGLTNGDALPGETETLFGLLEQVFEELASNIERGKYESA